MDSSTLLLTPSNEQGIVSGHDNKSEKTMTSIDNNLYLYSDELAERPSASTFLNSLASYSNTIPKASNDPDANQPQEVARMGTLIGVYLPCIQNIFGVILFIRLTWLVGTAGAIQGFLIVFCCCSVTLLTAISMSAIATNGVVPAGGSYFMISRSLGPEFGGAVGMLFYTGTTFAAAMYIIGAVEIAVTYMAPWLSLFGDFTKDPAIMYHNFRVYGTLLLIIMGTIVFFGVKFVNKFASVALGCVIFSIIAVYVGIFVNYNGNDKLKMCVLGKRLLKDIDINDCNKVFGGTLHKIFCPNLTRCDPYYDDHNITIVNGIRGLASGVFFENLQSSFLEDGQFIAKDNQFEDIDSTNKNPYNQVYVDITTTFTILIGIFFPSVTGIMAGSNRSGDLADAQRSIPVGTICAIITTSTVYLSAVLLFAGTVDNLLLRDKFGVSIGGRLVVANIAWPNHWVILIGSFLSTLGAGLQSLTGAPRLLQAIAKDGIIPFITPFAKSSERGEPVRALILTLIICQFGILLGNVDYLAPLLSMFFLMCYGFVNLACAVQTILRTPSWRPRFQYYHWSLSITGLSLCVAIMFMTSWVYALTAMVLAGLIYKYIEYRGAEKEWGDGIRGLALSAARFSLLRLEEGQPHTKNWRPQLLLLTKVTAELVPKHRKLFTFAAQLKAGKGLTVCVSVINGEFSERCSESASTKQNLQKIMDEEKVKGFVDIIVSNPIEIGLSAAVQMSGLGGLRPNTVILGWPFNWKDSANYKRTLNFISTVRHISAANMALIIPRGIENFPDSNTKLCGFIDIWWIVHDGGLLMLIPFLLKQHRTWKNCQLRIFSVADIDDNSIKMREDLKRFLYQLRIEAEVEVVELQDCDISAYTYERTILMEKRNQMLCNLGLNKRESKGLLQNIVDFNRNFEKQKDSTKVRFQDSCEESNGNAEGDVEGNSERNETDSQKVVVVSTTKPSTGRSDSNASSEGALSQITPPPPPHQFTTSTVDSGASAVSANNSSVSPSKNVTPSEHNVKRMHTAVKLNDIIKKKSKESQLVVINLPGLPKSALQLEEFSYMEYVDTLTDGLKTVLMVRGSGQEVITIYS